MAQPTQADLQDLRDQIAALQANQNQAPVPKHQNVKPLMLDSTDADAFFEWKFAYENAVDANSWSNKVARVMMRSYVCKEAQVCIRDIPRDLDIVPGTGDAADWHLMMDAYEAKMVPNNYLETLATRVELARQRDDENLATWHSRYKELYGRAFPQLRPTLDTWMPLIRGFLKGLINNVVASKAREHEPANPTYREVLQRAERMSAAYDLEYPEEQDFNQQHSSLRGTTQNQVYKLAAMAPGRQGQSRNQQQGRQPANLQRASRPVQSARKFMGRCYNCNKVAGHIARNCPEPRTAASKRRRSGPQGGQPAPALRQMLPQEAFESAEVPTSGNA